jgi:3-hydroxyisobutyrate dehydrogenase
MTQPHVTVLGLGIMGSRMAHRLLAAGFPVTVYNRSAEKSAPFAETQANVAATPREAAEHADVIVSMVSNDQVSRNVWLGPDGALAGARPGTVCIESSTLSVAWVRELAQAASTHGCDLLDAPVTGSKVHAGSGELTFLVGGSDAALAKARPVLAAMSKAIVPVGPTGSGALTKLINNFMCGVQVASTAQALTLIERSGLDRDTVLKVLTEGAPGSPLVKTMFARMTTGDYAPNFYLGLALKDLRYGIEEASKVGLDLTTASAAASVFQDAVMNGHGEQDFSAVVEPYRKWDAGVAPPTE